MSNRHPPQPPYGATYGSTPQMATILTPSYPGVQQYHHQPQGYNSYWQGQGLSNGMMLAQGTNGYAHHANIQGTNQPTFSAGVTQTQYGGYPNAAQSSNVPTQFQTNMPQSSYAATPYTPQQLSNSYHPSSNEPVATIPPTSRHSPAALSMNVKEITVAHSPRPELEDGELTSGELSNSMDDLYADTAGMQERPLPELTRPQVLELEKMGARDSFDSVESGLNNTSKPSDMLKKPPTAEAPLQTAPSLRKQAQAILRELHSYEIGFQDLADEGLEVDLLRALYAETELPLPPPKEQKKRQRERNAVNTIKSSTMTQNSNDLSSQNLSSNNINGSHIATKDPKIDKSMETSETKDPISNDDAASPQNPEPIKDVRVTSLGKNTTKITAAKPVDRKEYIARLMAAKSGKPVPISDALPGSHDVSSEAKMSASDASRSPPNKSQATIPNLMKDAIAPSTGSSQVQEEKSDMDAKRKAQTELALQKIEALRNQKKSPGQGQEIVPTTTEPRGFDHGPAAAEIRTATALSSAEAKPQVQTRVPSEHRQEFYFSPVSLKPAFSIPGLFTSSQDPSSQTDEKQSSTASATKALQPLPRASATDIIVENSEGPRKRQKAADFMYSPPPTLQKILSHGEDNGVVIDISDDDVDDEFEDSLSHQSSRFDKHQPGIPPNSGPRSENGEKHNVDKVSPPPGLLASRRSTRELANSTPSVSNTPNKTQQPQELKTKVIAIETMNRKIFELEQRIKAKQTASRGQSPRALAISSSIDGAANRQSSLPAPQRGEAATEEQLVLEKEKQQDELATAEAEKVEMAKIEEQKVDSEHHEQEKLVKLTEPKSWHERLDAQQPVEPVQRGRSMAAEASHQRKAFLEAELSALDAEMTRSQEMYEQAKLEIERIEHDMQSKTNHRGVLQQELIGLSLIDQMAPEVHAQPRPSHAIGKDAQAEREATIESVGVNGTSDVIGSSKLDTMAVKSAHVSPPGSNRLDRKSQKVRVEGKSHTAADTEAMDEAELGGDIHAYRTPANDPADDTDQTSEGELAEDNMDISGSDVDEGQVLESQRESLSRSEDAMSIADDGDVYEPPSHVDFTLPSTNSVDDDQRQRVDQGQQHLFSEKTPTGLSGVEVEQPVVEVTEDADFTPNLDAGHALNDGSSLPITREEEDYEPPEPESFVKNNSSPPNDSPNATLIDNRTEDNSDYPSEQVTSKSQSEIGHFIPYESPLKQFASYRFHPEYRKEVSGGYRSLTYSYDISPEVPICQYELAGGMCNDSSCTSQHFQKMALPDHLILSAMGKGEGSTPDEKEVYIKGLKSLILELRKRETKDLDTIAEAISNYRLKFLDDASKIHPL